MSDPLDANKRAISHASLPRRSLNSSGVTDGGVDEDATKAPPRAMSAWSLSRKSTTTAAASCDKPGMTRLALSATACFVAELAPLIWPHWLGSTIRDTREEGWGGGGWHPQTMNFKCGMIYRNIHNFDLSVMGCFTDSGYIFGGVM